MTTKTASSNNTEVPTTIEDRLRDALESVQQRRTALATARQDHADVVDDSGHDDSVTPTMLTDAAARVTIAEQRLRAAEGALRAVEAEQRRAVADRLGQAAAHALGEAIEMPVSYGALPATAEWGLELYNAEGREDLARGSLEGSVRVRTKRPRGLGAVASEMLTGVFPDWQVDVESKGDEIVLRGTFLEAVPVMLPDVVSEFTVSEAASQVARHVGSYYGTVFRASDRLGNAVPRLGVVPSKVTAHAGTTDEGGVRTVTARLTLLGRADDRDLPGGEAGALADGIAALEGLHTLLGRVSKARVVATGSKPSTTGQRPPYPTADVEIDLVSRPAIR